MSDSAAKRPDYADFNCRADDDLWRRAQVIWYWLGIPTEPGVNAIFIANIARSLRAYQMVERDAEKARDAKGVTP